jgi:hypothetical protein
MKAISFLAIVLAASLLLLVPISATAAPATKTTQIRKMEFLYTGVPITLCGQDRIVDWSVLIRNYIHKQYDDDSFDIKMTSYSEFRDATGLVATSPQTFHSSDSGMNSFNVIIRCADSSETTVSHVGFKIVDGEIVNLRLGGKN